MADLLNRSEGYCRNMAVDRSPVKIFLHPDHDDEATIVEYQEKQETILRH